MTSALRGGDCAADFDRTVPALVLKIGQDPLRSGPVGALRTLGRVGVPAFAVTEPGVTPAGLSRHCAGRFIWRATGDEDPGFLADALCEMGRQAGRRSVIVPMDDESAVLVAEYAARLSEHFLFPSVASGLPRQLASKSGLSELCEEHGVPAPASVVPAGRDELAAFAATATFPIVVKNAEAWDRRNPVGRSVGASSSGTRVLHDPAELLVLSETAAGAPGLIVQEYIPAEQAEDWIVHFYSDANADCRVIFSGLKVRSWPPVAGVTACGVSITNPVLTALTERFCKQIGYGGVADLDWRLDRRDGQYKLVDFNPRVGNNFRLFKNDAGIDVVRALHLDLTGREIPAGAQVDRARLVVEHIDIPARIARRDRQVRNRWSAGSDAPHRRPLSTEYAWLAADDPLPSLAMLTRVISLIKVLRRGMPRSAANRTAGRRPRRRWK